MVMMPFDAVSEETTKGPACQYSEAYSENIGSSWEDEQFRHLAKASSIPSHVTRTVTVTSSLSFKGGYEGNINFVLAKSKVNFELGYTGSETTSTTITCDIPGDNRSYYLVAGKLMQNVEGKKIITNTDCSRETQTTNLEGSTMTYHEAIRQ